ncbi:DEAD/DEAH box helicase [Pseudolysinimonas sp.]|jgi:superfamily II DNA/RNA helicase|uniref:DEAD/DEAH box helicase n=1 Tax=Pseudolysinimonas sp. TaxID=2680009 RepID=UPI003783F6ED
MPTPKKGASARSTTAGGPKKARWSTEQRAAQGKSPVRPRGTVARPVRERQADSADRRDNVERGQSTRPNWEPRDKAPRSNDRFGAPRTDRAPREGGYQGRSERPAREGGYQGRTERPAREGYAPRTERPAREGGYAPRTDRAPREGGYQGRSERPAREGYAPRTERPAREGGYAPRTDRAPREGGYAPRENRGYAPREDRGGYAPRTERPAREGYAPRTERPSYDRSDRAPRREYTPREGGYQPRNREGYEPRENRGFERDRDQRPAVHQEDVVLARLEAKAVDATDMTSSGFLELGLGQNLVRALSELGADSPFPIQAATIPSVLEGRDVLGRGRTGSGKTIAFGAPLVERLLQAQKGSTERRKPGRAPRALILAPTRELALQIDRTVQPLAQSVGLFTTQVYGGVPYQRQVGAIQRGVDIIIGTPGRIGDLVSQGRLDLSQVMITVLDEADHMCELGFLEPVRELLQRTSEGGQKLLYSATLDSGVASLVEEFLVDPAVYEISGEDQASSDIRHVAFLLEQRDKQDVLIELAGGPGKKLVFARTRAFAEQLADLLDEAGIRAESIHGDLNQSRRTRALEKFTSGRVSVLVATDVAARGIHVDDIELVIQADAPDEYKAYLHRAGRTGRAGKTGTVVTLVPRNRRRKTEELLARAEISPEWISVRPGDQAIADLAG